MKRMPDVSSSARTAVDEIKVLVYLFFVIYPYCPLTSQRYRRNLRDQATLILVVPYLVLRPGPFPTTMTS